MNKIEKLQQEKQDNLGKIAELFNRQRFITGEIRKLEKAQKKQEMLRPRQEELGRMIVKRERETRSLVESVRKELRR